MGMEAAATRHVTDETWHMTDESGSWQCYSFNRAAWEGCVFAMQHRHNNEAVSNPHVILLLAGSSVRLLQPEQLALFRQHPCEGLIPHFA